MRPNPFLPALLLTLVAPATAATPDLDWLAGNWCGGEAGLTIEERWLAPRGGELLGLSRTSQGERMVAFEFLRIVAVDGVPTYLAQPDGRPPTAFARTTGGEDWVRFENPAHDFPQRIEYRRTAEGLHAEISGPGDNGETQRMRFDYRPCAE